MEQASEEEKGNSSSNKVEENKYDSKLS